MKSLFFVALVILLCFCVSHANGWEKTLDFNLTLTQNSNSNSWVGGKAGSASWMANSNFKAAKQLCSQFT